jgi:hypothetical protein
MKPLRGQVWNELTRTCTTGKCDLIKMLVSIFLSSIFLSDWRVAVRLILDFFSFFACHGGTFWPKWPKYVFLAFVSRDSTLRLGIHNYLLLR